MFYKLSTGPLKLLNWTGWAVHTLLSSVGGLLAIKSNKVLLLPELQTYDNIQHLFI